MFARRSIAGRVAAGKAVGALVGVMAFLFLPLINVAYELEFRLGLVLFYVVLGAFIGLSGRLTVHPLGFSLNFWKRGLVLGGITHLVLALVAYENIALLLQTSAFAWLGLTSPYWIVLDGMIIGVIIGYTATKWAGEGDLPMR